DKCLAGVHAQTFQDFKTVVVDNGSSDGSPDLIEDAYPWVHLIRLPRNFGFCRANNIALEMCNSDYAALLNNDAIPDKDWLYQLVSALEKNPDAGFCASKMLYHDRPHVIDRAGDGYTTAGAGLLHGRGLKDDQFYQKPWIFGASAGAAIYRMSMLMDIGFFDEDFFLIYEDVDLSFRAQLFGYNCAYVPEAVVYHLATRSIGYDSPTAVYYGHRNLEWVYFKNMPWRLLIITAVNHTIYNWVAFLYFSINGHAKTYTRAKTDAIKSMKVIMKKRAQIQSRRKRGDRELWRLFNRELLLNRFTNRLKANRESTIHS
nr:glycosyltransferase family 2 protein [Deltaproteobacteria bacterium]